MKSGDARVALIGFPSVGKVNPAISVVAINYSFTYIIQLINFSIAFCLLHTSFNATFEVINLFISILVNAIE